MNRRQLAKQVTIGTFGAGSLLPMATAQAPAPKGASTTPSVASSNRIKSLKVERIEIFKVVVPMKPGTVLSDNYAAVPEIRDSWDVFSIPKHIIKLQASNGFVGLGETGRGSDLDAHSPRTASFSPAAIFWTSTWQIQHSACLKG